MYTGELITLTAAVPGNGQLVCAHTHYRRAKLQYTAARPADANPKRKEINHWVNDAD
jgi:hypothetical protein